MSNYITNFIPSFETIKSIPFYFGLLWKGIKLRSDINKAIKEFPNIREENKLLVWCTKNSELLVNYATYTTFTQVDDWIALQVRWLISNHWDLIYKTILVFETGTTNERDIVAALCDDISNNTEIKNPMVVLMVVPIIFNIIRLIRTAKTQTETTTDTDTDTETITPKPNPSKRPVLNFIRNILRGRK
jgi:hypothetical protein